MLYHSRGSSPLGSPQTVGVGFRAPLGKNSAREAAEQGHPLRHAVVQPRWAQLPTCADVWHAASASTRARPGSSSSFCEPPSSGFTPSSRLGALSWACHQAGFAEGLYCSTASGAGILCVFPYPAVRVQGSSRTVWNAYRKWKRSPPSVTFLYMRYLVPWREFYCQRDCSASGSRKAEVPERFPLLLTSEFIGAVHRNKPTSIPEGVGGNGRWSYILPFIFVFIFHLPVEMCQLNCCSMKKQTEIYVTDRAFLSG